ncbi:MAG: hypothetical protein ABIA78_01545 [archaeon]
MQRGIISTTIAVIIVLSLGVLYYLSFTGKESVTLMIAAPILTLTAAIICFRNILKLEKSAKTTISKIILWIPIVLAIIVTVILFVAYINLILDFVKDGTSLGKTERISWIILGGMYLIFSSVIWIAEGIFIIKFDKNTTTKLGKRVTVIVGIILYGFTAFASFVLMALPHVSMGTYGVPLHRPNQK